MTAASTFGSSFGVSTTSSSGFAASPFGTGQTNNKPSSIVFGSASRTTNPFGSPAHFGISETIVSTQSSPTPSGFPFVAGQTNNKPSSSIFGMTSTRTNNNIFFGGADSSFVSNPFGNTAKHKTVDSPFGPPLSSSANFGFGTAKNTTTTRSPFSLDGNSFASAKSQPATQQNPFAVTTRKTSTSTQYPANPFAPPSSPPHQQSSLFSPANNNFRAKPNSSAIFPEESSPFAPKNPFAVGCSFPKQAGPANPFSVESPVPKQPLFAPSKPFTAGPSCTAGHARDPAASANPFLVEESSGKHFGFDAAVSSSNPCSSWATKESPFEKQNRKPTSTFFGPPVPTKLHGNLFCEFKTPAQQLGPSVMRTPDQKEEHKTQHTSVGIPPSTVFSKTTFPMTEAPQKKVAPPSPQTATPTTAAPATSPSPPPVGSVVLPTSNELLDARLAVLEDQRQRLERSGALSDGELKPTPLVAGSDENRLVISATSSKRSLEDRADDEDEARFRLSAPHPKHYHTSFIMTNAKKSRAKIRPRGFAPTPRRSFDTPIPTTAKKLKLII